MAEHGKKKPEAKKVITQNTPVIKRGDDFVSRYANGVTIINTQFDLQLIFGQLTCQPDRAFAVQEHTLITMTPSHAKSLYELLGKRLQDWEQSFGTIQLLKTRNPQPKRSNGQEK